MPSAIIAGGITAAGTIGGALLSSSSQKHAASQVAQQQQQATDAQLQLGQESLGLNRDIYNSNYALLNPFVQRGNQAGVALNALLGLSSGDTGTGSTAPGTPPTNALGPTQGLPTGEGPLPMGGNPLSMPYQQAIAAGRIVPPNGGFGRVGQSIYRTAQA